MNTSKNASTHICTTIHLQKSAITKLVSGRATKPEINNRGIPIMEYMIQLGRFQGIPLTNAGLIPLNTTMPHSTKISMSSTWKACPKSTNSHPWWPKACHQSPKSPIGPKTMPVREPATRTIKRTKSKLISRSWCSTSFLAKIGRMKMEEAIQQVDIQYRESIRCQLLETVIGKDSERSTPKNPR